MLQSPFDDRPIEEIKLVDPPLSRVLAQVRHPSLTLLTGEAGAEPAHEFALSVVDAYPVAGQRTHESQFQISEQGIIKPDNTEPFYTWRLISADGDWQVSYNKDFIALETSAYPGRKEFCRRFEDLLSAYASATKAPITSRVGIRYTNRLADPQLIEAISSMVRAELLGPMQVAVALPSNASLRQSFGSAIYDADDTQLIINWGLLPANTVFDPGMTPFPDRSWLLDIDAAQSVRLRFAADAVASLVERLAERAYRGFRWAVTDQFIGQYSEKS